MVQFSVLKLLIEQQKKAKTYFLILVHSQALYINLLRLNKLREYKITAENISPERNFLSITPKYNSLAKNTSYGVDSIKSKKKLSVIVSLIEYKTY